MSSYEPLKQHLAGQKNQEIPMTFDEVARILGGTLPASAYKYRPWWANETRGHSQAKAWIEAGYETSQVDMASRKLVFRRKAAGLAGSARKLEPSAGPAQDGRHPIFGALKGTFVIEAGWDVSQGSFDAADQKALDTAIEKKAGMLDRGLSR